MAEFFHLHLACCLVAALLAKVLDDTLVLAGVGELGAADVEGAHTLLALDQESEKKKGQFCVKIESNYLELELNKKEALKNFE